MLGRRKKTGAQVMRDITENITTRIGKRSLPIVFFSKIGIVLFSISILVGFYGFASRMSDISKKEYNIEKLQNEYQDMKADLERKQMLKLALIDDPLTIEAVARRYGMSKKDEKIFYFVD
ncbi:MAG: septum formation initiator family protein [Fibromonadales bacterium]|nr:septum formation initiator family protein [Fibromonadales bacterium]